MMSITQMRGYTELAEAIGVETTAEMELIGWLAEMVNPRQTQTLVELFRRSTAGRASSGTGDISAEVLQEPPTIDEIRSRFPRYEWRWINSWESQILHRIALGDGWLVVIGHADVACCEWVYWPSFRGSIEDARHSNDGYSGVPACLRDGLIHVEGLPGKDVLAAHDGTRWETVQ